MLKNQATNFDSWVELKLQHLILDLFFTPLEEPFPTFTKPTFTSGLLVKKKKKVVFHISLDQALLHPHLLSRMPLLLLKSMQQRLRGWPSQYIYWAQNFISNTLIASWLPHQNLIRWELWFKNILRTRCGQILIHLLDNKIFQGHAGKSNCFYLWRFYWNFVKHKYIWENTVKPKKTNQIVSIQRCKSLVCKINFWYI